MQILRCRSSLGSMPELVKAASRIGGHCLLLSPKAIKTGLGLEAAFELAKRAARRRQNASEKLSNEAMLFLSCGMNFGSALRKVGAADPSDFVFVSQRKIPPKKLACLLKLTACRRLALSRMGKKLGGYFEGELEIEGMALGRIRN
ncbi:MAG: hypothetical protein N3E51_01960 [Candidatus Micrarchaeota archaeon]|nr:hypothetical protein [Candidatus Micrarchaeota archaeon]